MHSRNVAVGTILILFIGLILLGVFRQMRDESQASIGRSTAAPVATLDALLLVPIATAVVAPSATVPTPPVPAAPTTIPAHTIQAGETLVSISQQYGLTHESLAAANDIVNPNLLQIGQVLSIPSPTPTVDPAAPVPVEATAEVPGEPGPPADLNGIPLASIIIMPPAVRDNVTNIFAQGRQMGRNAAAYSKVGDSTILNPHFMARFDEPGNYHLGPYAYLQPAIDHFLGSHSREGEAARLGFHAWSVTDPTWANKTNCQPNESSLTCELRSHNAAFVLIRLGSNDSGAPDIFAQNVRLVVEEAVANGVVPVIGTKADRFEGSNANNEVLRQIASDYQVPLWDFDVAAQMIPGRGLDVDFVHLSSFYAHDYASPVAFQRGHGVHNLTALMMLHTLLEQIVLAPES